MYKNKLVAEVNKEIEKENEAKALEAKKQKIRQMLSIIESKENNITKILEGIEIEKKEIVTLKEQLEKEDFSFLSPMPNTFGIGIEYAVGCTYTGGIK